MERIYHDAEHIEDPAEDWKHTMEAMAARLEALAYNQVARAARYQWRRDNKGYPAPDVHEMTALEVHEYMEYWGRRLAGSRPRDEEPCRID
jgi:hypothetical protein